MMRTTIAIKRDKVTGITSFDESLTDYDRILLKFGMHILWR